MGEVTVYTSAKFDEIMADAMATVGAGAVVGGSVVGGDPVLTRGDGTTVSLPLQRNVTNVVMTGVAATDTAAIQAAIDAQNAGRPSLIRIISDAATSGLGVIDATIALNKAGCWIEAVAPATAGAGARLRWDGAPGGTMISVTAPRCGLRNIALDANSLAATCVDYQNGERMGWEDITCEKFIGNGVKIGNGVANNNGFVGKGVLYLRGLGGSVGLVVDGVATEDVNLEVVNCSPVVGAVGGMLRHVDLVNGHVNFTTLMLDDDEMLDYAIRVQAGSFVIQNLISECHQTLGATAVGRSRGSAILVADCRSSSPQVGQYAMEWRAAGDESSPLFLGGVRINRLAGATVSPDVHVNGGTLHAFGLYFTTSDAGVPGTVTSTSTGNVYWFSDEGGLIDGPLRLDAGEQIRGKNVGTERTLLEYSVSGNLTIGDNVMANLLLKALTSLAFYANNVEVLRLSTDNGGRAYFVGPKILVSSGTDLEVDGPLNHDGTTVGFYGATPVVKAANPGTATGVAATDAVILNAVVTALRNLGLVT